jgi:hypothetical protein
MPPCAIAAVANIHCCMHRGCAACRGIRFTCKVIQNDRTHPTGYTDVQKHTGNILSNLFWYLLQLLCCNCCTGLCSMPTARYRLHGMSDCVITCRTAGIRSLACCAKAQHQTGQLSLQVIWLLPHAQGLCNANSQAGCSMLDRSNTWD